MPSVVRITAQGKVEDLDGKEAAKHGYLAHLDAMVVLIQDLIPLGLQAFAEVLQAEVAALAGARYSRTGGRPGVVRWGQQAGSIFLADQKVPVTVQRVRDQQRGQEIPLQTYQRFQAPRRADVGLFRKVLAGLSCRDYEASAEAVPAAFGLSASSVSRRFIRASAAGWPTYFTTVSSSTWWPRASKRTCSGNRPTRRSRRGPKSWSRSSRTPLPKPARSRGS